MKIGYGATWIATGEGRRILIYVVFSESYMVWSLTLLSITAHYP